MPDGRFISKSIAHSEQLAGVSLNADYLFTRCIPHLDREGRMTGNPQLIKAVAVPLRTEITAETIPSLLEELVAAELVVWYSVEGRQALQFPGFTGHQKGMKKDREAASRLPDPADPKATSLNVESCAGPAQVLQRSGSSAAKVDVSEVEVKSKLSPSEVKKPSAAAASVAEPLNVPPEPTPKRTRKPKPTPTGSAAVPAENWLASPCAAWEKHFGAGSFRAQAKKAAGLLSPLKDAGLSGADIGRRLERYCAQRKAGYCTLADFAQHHGQYAPPPLESLRPINGEMSAELERETRPPGAPPPKYPLPSGMAHLKGPLS